MNGYLENNLPDLVVIVPVYNEEKILLELYARLTKAAKQVSENYRISVPAVAVIRRPST